MNETKTKLKLNLLSIKNKTNKLKFSFFKVLIFI